MVNFTDILMVWISVFLVFCVFSYCYRENPLFRLAEHLFVGLSVGYGISYDLWFFKNYGYLPVVYQGRYDYLIWMLIGLGYYFFFSRRYFWLYRLPISIGIGYGTGMALRSVIRSDLIGQINTTIKLSLIGVDPLTTLNRFIIVFGTMLAVVFFIFTLELKGALSYIPKTGRYVILAALGASFGNTIMGRESLLIQRIQLMMGSKYFPWEAAGIGTVEAGSYAWIMTLICAAILLYMIYIDHVKSKRAAAEATATGN